MAAKSKRVNVIPARISPDGQKLTPLEAELIEGEIELAESLTSLCSSALPIRFGGRRIKNQSSFSTQAA